jgi:hypothetical protein
VALRVHAVVVAALVATACSPSTTASPAATTDDEVWARHGLRVGVPEGWWASDRRLSTGVSPVFRLTLSDRPLQRTRLDQGPCYAGIRRQLGPSGVVAILREALGTDFEPGRFERRPARFPRPERRSGDYGCLGDRSSALSFKEAGRGFYLWIAAGRRASEAKLDRLMESLDTMRIAPRRDR